MKLSGPCIVLSLVTLLLSFWHRNELPKEATYTPGIAVDPRQEATRKPEFAVSYKGIAYRIEPQFDYELTGMVVSLRHHDGNSRMHRRAGDHLNMLDVCVIWGDNVANPRLDKIDFWNGIFTCNVKTRDRAAWEAFDMVRLSNNHLISDRDEVRESVSGVRIGDQIRIRGMLASYTGPVGTRGTSTTRTDTGDGACETIYLEEFTIMTRTPNHWRTLMYVSLFTLLAAIVLYLRSPYRPFASS